MVKHNRARAAVVSVVVGLALAGCPEDQVLTTTRNLNRPGPLALVCAARVGDGGQQTGLSASHCTADAGVNGATKGSLYGFVANTARGEVAVFRPNSSGERLLDLDRASPGFGFIPVGSLPTALQATPESCYVVTANSGSCDMSLIDVPAVMKVAAGELKQSPSGAVVSSSVPRTAIGPLRARPQDLLLVPTKAAPKGEALCTRPKALKAWVTFPRCNLVAEVDLISGQLTQGVVLGADGHRFTTSPSCPVECVMRGDNGRVDAGRRDLPPPDKQRPDKQLPDKQLPDAPAADGPPPDAGVADAATGDGGGQDASSTIADPLDASASDSTSAAGVLPHGLAYDPDDNKLYVGSAGAGFVTVIDVDPADGAFTKVSRIKLSGGAASTRVRLSPKTRRLGRYLYVIARDRSVRVVSTTLQQECETNLDLAHAPEAGVPLALAGCFPVGGKQTLPRRVTAEGPGLRFGQWLPMDVEFVTAPQINSDASVTDARPHSVPMQGIYALVAVSDGAVFVVDLEDWNVVKATSATVPALRLPHRKRNAYQGLIAEVSDASVVAIKGASTGSVPVIVSKTTGSVDAGATLPGHGINLRAPGEAVGRDWLMVYEDRLVASWGGSLDVTSDRLTLTDTGARFCRGGVEARQASKGRYTVHGDIFKAVGCKDDNECGLEQVCAKSVANPSQYGLCLEKDRQTELFTRCVAFLGAERELLVTRAGDTRLSLDVLSHQTQKVIKQTTQPAGGCASNDDCDAHFLCALDNQALNKLTKGECFRPGCTTDADCEKAFCVQPLDGSPKVCSPMPLPLEQGPKCTTDADCAPQNKGKLGARCATDGDCADPRMECRKASTAASQRTCVSRAMRCAGFPGLKNVCVRVSPCFAELLRYDVLAGRAFVMGSYNRRGVDPQTGQCAASAAKSALLQNRLPVGLPIYPVLLGPQCKSAPGPLGQGDPNPCIQRVQHGYSGFTDRTGTTAYTSVTGTSPATLVRFSNPDLWLSLGVSHLTTPPVHSGVADGGVIGGTSLPMPTRNLSIQLGLSSGYTPLRVSSNNVVSLPARLVQGPDGWVYMVDMGDTSGTAGASGQVVRINRTSAVLDNFQIR